MLAIQKQIRHLFFRDKARIFSIFAELLENQNRPLPELEQFQLQKLNRLLNHAAAHVPYYRKLLGGRRIIDGNRFKLTSLKQLGRIPFLTKEIIEKEQAGIYADDYQKRQPYFNYSGGSTGRPVKILQDRNYRLNDEASLLQLKNWRGVDPFDSEFFIWGAERDTFEGKKPFTVKINEFLRNRIIVNCFRMTEDEMKNIVRMLNKHKPKMIRAYADAIYEIARYARQNNLEVAPQQVIHTGAGTLHQYMREEIEAAFQCPVFNHYGGREVGSIATECSAHDGLHILQNHNWVEIIDKNGQPCQPGEEGEIVVTNLNNYSMPIIRYKIGDFGIMKENRPCTCGCNYPRLQQVVGRVGDIFITSDGRRISPVFFAHLIGVMTNDGSIARYQAIQKSPDKIIIKLVARKNIDTTVFTEIKSKLKFVMGGECRIEFEFVKEISPTPTGKYRYTINEMSKQ